MKKHKLLREDILPSMASNRKVQRLLNEFMDLLSEYDIAEVNQDQRNSILPKSSTSPTKQRECGLQATDQMDTSPPIADQNDSVTAAIDLNDNAQIANDETTFALPPAVEGCSDSPMIDQVKQDGQAKEADS